MYRYDKAFLGDCVEKASRVKPFFCVFLLVGLNALRMSFKGKVFEGLVCVPSAYVSNSSLVIELVKGSEPQPHQ